MIQRLPNSHGSVLSNGDGTYHYPCSGWLRQTCIHGNIRWIPLFCKRWVCEICGPIKKRRLQGRFAYAYKLCAAHKQPLRFVTLTYKEDVTLDTVRKTLARLAARVRKAHGLFEYARFPELTKAGRVHLHLVVLAPYIPQPLLAEWWNEVTHGSYIVDIRLVRSIQNLISYVTKYVTKSPASKVTFSRQFPDAFRHEKNPPNPKATSPFLYEFTNTYDAAIQSAGSITLWTGEVSYHHGP